MARARRRTPALAAAATPFAGATPATVALAVLAAAAPLIFWSDLRDAVVIPKLSATFVLGGAALAAVAWTGAWAHVDWRRCLPALAPLALFLLIAIIATGAGVDPIRSLLGEDTRYQGLVPLVLYALVLLAATGAVAAAGTPRLALAGLVLGGTLSAVYGALQRFGVDPVEWAGLPEGRIGATFAQPNALGTELVVAGAVAVGFWAETSGRTRAALALVLGVMTLVLLFTLSRGAWVAAAAASVVLASLFVRRPPTQREAAIGAAAAVAMLAVFLALPSGREFVSDVVHRARSTFDISETSPSQRLGLWRMSLDMIADHPVLGLGPDGFSQRFAAYRTPDQPGFDAMNVRPESTHNLFLDLAVGVGLPGLLAWLAFLAGVAWVVARGWRGLEPENRRYAGAMAAALVGYFVAVFFAFGEGMTGWIPWLLTGALLGTVGARPPQRDAWRRPSWPAWLTPQAGAGYAAAAAMAVFGVMLVVADWSAGEAARQARAGDIQRAIDLGRVAVRWNPLFPQYYLDLGTNQQNAGVFLGRAYLEDAVDTYETVNSRFEPTAVSLLQEAQARARLTNMEREADRAQVFDLLERAVALDPYNADIRRGVAEFYELAGETERAARHRAELERFAPEAAGAQP
ncbi:MAG TPA: O-antigen ligase family protein [Dehalococcoidia bacterium]|nr:O-antigen ligase family protein [Dehalococcoidia bacterium]